MKCPPLKKPDYGYVTISGDYYHDSSATYQCDKYYVLYGPSTRKCRYGVWDRKAPICKRKTIYLIFSHTSLLNYSTQTVIKCPPLKHPKYGNVYITGEYEHDSTASYKCDKYYKIDGPSSRKCRYGEWLGKAPICKRKAILHLIPFLVFLNNSALKFTPLHSHQVSTT